MNNKISGRAFVLGDNIDTDQIIPAEHLVYSTSDPEELKNYGRFALSGVPPREAGLPEGSKTFIKEGEFTSEFQVIIGGSNFGCGSSREHAPFALQVAGVKAVIAESYARIFYRNCVDGGFLLPFESPIVLNNQIKTGDELELDVNADILKNITTGKTYNLRSLGDILPIIEAGDIFKYARQSGMIA